MFKNVKYFFIITFLIFVFLIYQNTYCYSQNLYKNETIDRIEKHWWGYRRYMSNEQVEKFSSKFDFVAAELGFVSGISIPISFLNPLAGIVVGSVLDFSSSYFWLLSSYVSKVNRGNGVIIDFTKGFIFRIIGI